MDWIETSDGYRAKAPNGKEYVVERNAGEFIALSPYSQRSTESTIGAAKERAELWAQDNGDLP